jgi:hypothetical protein
MLVKAYSEHAAMVAPPVPAQHEPEQHELEYAGAARSGDDIWQCPRCGHRMLTRWTPYFQAEVLAEGDPPVPHVGHLGAAMAGHRVLRGPAASLTTGERSWLENNGIDWDGDADGIEGRPAA